MAMSDPCDHVKPQFFPVSSSLLPRVPLPSMTPPQSLSSLHESASTKTNILHDACQKLLQDQTSLVQYGETLTRRLNYFTEHEKLHAKLNSPTLSVLRFGAQGLPSF